MIRAAALSYAIVFSLLIGLVCSGILFISSSQKRIEVTHNTKERLLFDSYSAIQLARFSDKKKNVFNHENGDTSKTIEIQWGGFTVFSTHTFHGAQFKNRSALVGEKTLQQLPALYLPGKIGSLKLSGDTRLEGKVYVPNKKIERANIAGQSYKHDKLVFGEIFKAENDLPKLKSAVRNLTISSFSSDLIKQAFKARDSVYSFQDPTTLYTSLSALNIENKISGNVIIHSFDSIYVTSESKLKGVILVAPKIRIQSGFKGDIQAVVHESIVLEEGVVLEYPSTIVLNELAERLEDNERYVILEKGAELRGGILVTSQKKDFRRPPSVKLNHETVVSGIVYVNGQIELHGNIIGSLFTESIRLNVGGGRYSNHLMDVIISADRVPKDFLYPSWLETEKKNRLKVISFL